MVIIILYVFQMLMLPVILSCLMTAMCLMSVFRLVLTDWLIFVIIIIMMITIAIVVVDVMMMMMQFVVVITGRLKIQRRSCRFFIAVVNNVHAVITIEIAIRVWCMLSTLSCVAAAQRAGVIGVAIVASSFAARAVRVVTRQDCCVEEHVVSAALNDGAAVRTDDEATAVVGMRHHAEVM